MTDDLEVAIEEGSTMVRIGRDLFGPRPSAARASDNPPGLRIRARWGRWPGNR